MASSDYAHISIAVNIIFSEAAKALYYDDEALGPRAATNGSAGFDLCAALPEDSPELDAMPGDRVIIPTGISIEPLRDGIAGFVYSRSGLGAVKGLTVAQGVGLIDPDYRGEIFVYLLNTSPSVYRLQRGDRIAQLVFQPYYRPQWQVVTELGVTERGSGGFGHSGK